MAKIFPTWDLVLPYCGLLCRSFPNLKATQHSDKTPKDCLYCRKPVFWQLLIWYDGLPHLEPNKIGTLLMLNPHFSKWPGSKRLKHVLAIIFWGEDYPKGKCTSQKTTWQRKKNHLKMYLLSKIVKVPASHVSLPKKVGGFSHIAQVTFCTRTATWRSFKVILLLMVQNCG